MVKYTYSSLVDKYSSFSVPCIEINIKGKKVKTLLAKKNEKDNSLHIKNVDVHLSMEKSSVARITIDDVYDYSKSQLSEVATIGASMEISLGYGSSSTKVFSGYIAQIDYEFNNVFEISIIALDALNLMEQESCPAYYVSKSYDDIVKDVLGKYSSLITKKSLDNLGVTREFISREEKISDLHFIRRLCNECGKMFYVSKGEAFIKDKFDSNPIVNLDIHEMLYSFKLSKSYKNSKIKVIGFDKENHTKDVTGESTVKVSEYKSATTSPQTKVIVMPDISTSADAKKYAESQTKEILKNINTGNIYCIGLPEIEIGKVITISGVDKNTFDKYKFNVTEVIHTIDRSGFNTSVGITGWS